MDLLTEHFDANNYHIIFASCYNSKLYTMVPNLIIIYDLKTLTLIPRGCEDTLFDETHLESYSDCSERSTCTLDVFLFIRGEE